MQIPSRSSNRILLEIAVDNLPDAIAAYRAGADRIELVSDLARHGVTPIPELMRDVKATVPIPVMAMLRPDPGSPIADQRMVAIMLHQAEGLLEAGADGLVFGVLTPQMHVDRDATAMIVQMAGTRETVFHRAFDMTPDPAGAINTLVDRGVTRILTAGMDRPGTMTAMGLADAAPAAPPPGLVVRLRKIRAYVEAAGDRIQILACGGVRGPNARQFVYEGGVAQLHSAARSDSAAGLDVGQVGELRSVLG